MSVYLDHNATTPPHEDVLAAMARAAREGWANPSSVHAAGRAARRFVEDAREAVAALAGESPRDVVFTSGGTEANNLALRRPFHGGRGLLVTSRLEHPSAVRVAEALADEGIRCVWLPVARSGRLDPDDVARALASRSPDEPTLVAIHAVHAETGVVQPVDAIVRMAHAAGAEVHVDAVQAAGRVTPERWRGGDTVALAAHKLRGPKGIGAIVTRPGIVVRPLLRGGAQERGLRPGTVDAVAAAGFGVAARRALEGGPSRYRTLAPLRDSIESGIVRTASRHGVVAERLGDDDRAPHVSLVAFEGWRGDELVAALDLEGVCVSSGTACTAGTAEPSTAVSAMVGEAVARSVVRVSLGEPSTPSDRDSLLGALDRVLARAR